MKQVVYGIDIGVYRTNRNGEPLQSRSSFAWARVDGKKEAEAIFKALRGKRRSALFGDEHTGTSLAVLWERICSDVEAERSIALGFEAPMWQCFTEDLTAVDVFEKRFDQESGHEWYMQAGAGATVKTLSLGVGLFRAFRQCSCCSGLEFTTDRKKARRRMNLFEAFVAGPFKPSGSNDRIDAKTAAVLYALEREEMLLHPTQGDAQNVISHWNSILGNAGFETHSGPGRCAIVGYRFG